MCIEPDEFAIAKPAVYEKASDQQRQAAGKQEMELLLDLFDSEALLGNNLKSLK